MTLPILQNRDTLLMISYGFVLMVWFSSENTSLAVVSGLGAGLSFLLVRLLGLRKWGGKTFLLRQWIPAAILLGLLVGFGAVWSTAGLMVFKNAWHAHASPDFPAALVTGIIQRWWSWALAGGLVGASAALFRLAVR